MFRTERNAPVWYEITIDSSELLPNLDYTLSYWQAEDDAFNPNNLSELKMGNCFYYAATIVKTSGQDEEYLAIDWANGASSDSTYSTYKDAIQGELVQTIQRGDLVWNRYKKVFRLPGNEMNDLVDINGNVYDRGSHKYKIYCINIYLIMTIKSSQTHVSEALK